MTAAAASPEPGRSRFALPSAYTILFVLIVIVAALTWIIPAGHYDSTTTANPSRAPTTRSRRTRSGSSATR